MDGDDEFYDVVPLHKKANKDYMSLSTNTIYHSTTDIGMELENLNSNGGDQSQKVDRQTKVVTYSMWRDRKWQNFNNMNVSVDFVLAFDEKSSKHSYTRSVFEANLAKVGLLLEREETQQIHFVKIHAQHNVMCQYAEILKLRMPIKEEPGQEPKRNILYATAKQVMDKCKLTLDPSKFPPRKYQLTAEFSRDKSYLFDMDTENFFTPSDRVMVISYILDREKFGSGEQDKGIKRLIAEGVYTAAYPLHDGHLDNPRSKRKLLLDEWASISKCIKFQPLDEIKDYFGVKFALYFAWLGFYCHMLIPATVVGLLCLIYAWVTASSDSFTHDVCTKNITMCPQCDKYCDYWNLKDSCTFTKLVRFVDNPATIFFAVFMSFWSTLYLELWKRYSAGITHRWGMTGFDLLAEPPRPEYLMRLAHAKKTKVNVVTLLSEPVVPYWKVKLPSIILSFTIVLLWAFIAIAIVLGIVLCRMSLLTSAALYADQNSYRVYLIPITAAVLNLIGIQILTAIYSRLAVWLTEMELQRTQTEYDESLTVKNYIFEFVNYYSSIFYVAFLKGKFVGYPAKYNRIFDYRQEECSLGGCLMELTIQLVIIMIGNQALNALIEMITPLMIKWYNTFKVTTGIEKAKETKEVIITCNQWTEDYKLAELEPNLFSEYLEMVLQYGFITIFVAAFPLAPLFALINNVFEMRLDAKKFLKYYRRPIPCRVKDIGVWYRIMAVVGRISVFTNAFIIAFSSSFIPKLVYTLKISEDNTDSGFLDFSLAYFDTRDFPNETAPINPQMDVPMCRYSEFRNPPDHELKYKRPLVYWHILAARLAFIVVYQNLVDFVVTVVQWTIPDVPRRLNDQIKREAYRVREAIIKHEVNRGQEQKISPKGRESIISSETIYVDANGDFTDTNDLIRNRHSVYHDTTEL